MAVVQYGKGSRLYTTQQATWFLGNYNDRGLYHTNSDLSIILESKYNLRPDLLSYDLYGTVDYRWTFLMLNPDILKDPIYDFKTGILIYYATMDRLRSVLGS